MTTPEDLPVLTTCGLPGVDRVPYGMHACHFYRDRDELVAALSPYFIAGLRANERCLWVTAPPLLSREAIQVLRDAWGDAEDALHSGALRVLDFERWYETSKGLKGLDVVDVWLKEEERALADGYSGLRITGNISFLTPERWPAFMEYEQAVTAGFHGRRIIALCSYCLPHCNDEQVAQVIQAHTCAFERTDDDWQVVSDPGFVGAGARFLVAPAST